MERIFHSDTYSKWMGYFTVIEIIDGGGTSLWDRQYMQGVLKCYTIVDGGIFKSDRDSIWKGYFCDTDIRTSAGQISAKHWELRLRKKR